MEIKIGGYAIVCDMVTACLLLAEAVHSSETSVNFCQTTWHLISEDSIVHSQNLKSNKHAIVFEYFEFDMHQ
jgi:hypothetical protein